MSNIYLTSDWHIGHANIIKYCNRPFANSNEMDDCILTNYNEMVKPDDVVYHLGDVGFAHPSYITKMVNSFNGTIHLIRGNHDKNIKFLLSLFETVENLRTITIGNQPIVLCHYAMRVWDRRHYGSYHCYGHSHGTLPPATPDELSMDVGVDCNGFKPVPFDEIVKIMSGRNPNYIIDRKE